MRRRFSLTALVLVMTAGALAVPCIHWYLAGTRDTARRAAELEQKPQQDAA